MLCVIIGDFNNKCFSCPERLKGEQATAFCINLARKGATKEEIKNSIEAEIGYNLNFTCDWIRDSYTWGGTFHDIPKFIYERNMLYLPDNLKQLGHEFK